MTIIRRIGKEKEDAKPAIRTPPLLEEPKKREERWIGSMGMFHSKLFCLLRQKGMSEHGGEQLEEGDVVVAFFPERGVFHKFSLGVVLHTKHGFTTIASFDSPSEHFFYRNRFYYESVFSFTEGKNKLIKFFIKNEDISTDGFHPEEINREVFLNEACRIKEIMIEDIQKLNRGPLGNERIGQLFHFFFPFSDQGNVKPRLVVLIPSSYDNGFCFLFGISSKRNGKGTAMCGDEVENYNPEKSVIGGRIMSERIYLQHCSRLNYKEIGKPVGRLKDDALNRVLSEALLLLK